MKILGFEINRIRKKEYIEAEKYNRVVVAILDNINGTKRMVDELVSHLSDMSYVSMIANQFSYIDNLCNLYMTYKFASPSAMLIIRNNLSGVQSGISRLNDFVAKSIKFQAYIDELIKERGISVNSAFKQPECQEFINEEREMLSLIQQQFRVILINIMSSLSKDHINMMHDVDIVKEYHKNCKLKVDNKDCESYNITFKIIPKNKILSDEENKINLKEEK